VSLSQSSPIVPPIPSDRNLSGFSQVIQNSFKQLFQAGHIHRVVTVAPKPNDGAVGDIYLFDDNTDIYLYIKTSRGWAKSSILTLI
jgi:hypothetical protein